MDTTLADMASKLSSVLPPQSLLVAQVIRDTLITHGTLYRVLANVIYLIAV